MQRRGHPCSLLVYREETRAMNASLISSYYVPWRNETADATEVHNESRSLRLSVRYDKSEACISDTIRCRVEAERVRFRGYGMLLAEVGLPPGWIATHWSRRPKRFPASMATKFSRTA